MTNHERTCFERSSCYWRRLNGFWLWRYGFNYFFPFENENETISWEILSRSKWVGGKIKTAREGKLRNHFCMKLSFVLESRTARSTVKTALNGRKRRASGKKFFFEISQTNRDGNYFEQEKENLWRSEIFYFVLEFVKPPFNDRPSTEIAAWLSFLFATN